MDILGAIMMAYQRVFLGFASVSRTGMRPRGCDAPIDQIVSPIRGHAHGILDGNFGARFGVNKFHDDGVARVAVDVLKRCTTLWRHAPSFSPFANGHDDSSKVFASWRGQIFETGRAFLIGLPRDQAFIGQTVQAIRQNIGRNTERLYKFVKAAQSEQKIAHDQNTPAVPQNGNSRSNGATVNFGFVGAWCRFCLDLWSRFGFFWVSRRIFHMPNIATFELQVGGVLLRAL